MGAQVDEVSIPMHRDGLHIWNAVATEGALAQMVLHDGMGLNWQGYYTTGIVDYHGRARRSLADNFSDTVKFVISLGRFRNENYHRPIDVRAEKNIAVAIRHTMLSIDEVKKHRCN